MDDMSDRHKPTNGEIEEAVNRMAAAHTSICKEMGIVPPAMFVVLVEPDDGFTATNSNVLSLEGQEALVMCALDVIKDADTDRYIGVIRETGEAVNLSGGVDLVELANALGAAVMNKVVN